MSRPISLQISPWAIAILLIGGCVSGDRAFAHGGHGNEFQPSNNAAPVNTVKVDAPTIQRLGIQVESVKRQPLALGILATGQIESLPSQRVEVTTPVRGTVTKLLVQPGDPVQAGQGIAILSSPELAELRVDSQRNRVEAIANIQQAQANVDLARKNYQRQQAIAQAELQEAQAQLNFAQEKYDRDQTLASAGALSRRQALESKTELAAVKTEVSRAASRLQFLEADAQLQRANADLQVAKSRLTLSDGTYQARLQQLETPPNPDGTITIKAPIAGIVASQNTTQGESGEDAGKPILTILNQSRVLVAANIYEKDIDQVKIGQGVRIKVNGLPDQRFQGRVSFIAPTVTGEQRVVSVKAELDNPNGVLKPGTFANLEILTDRTTDPVLVIPQSAVVETPDKQTLVFIQNGSSFQPVHVTLGQRSGDLVQVKQGLFPRDQVVTQRAPQLYAQSLRIASQETHENPGSASESVPSTGVGLSFPWWSGAMGGGAIALTFWAGSTWAKRSMRHQSQSLNWPPSDWPPSNLQPSDSQPLDPEPLDPEPLDPEPSGAQKLSHLLPQPLHSPPCPPILGGSEVQSPPELGDLGGQCNGDNTVQPTSASSTTEETCNGKPTLHSTSQTLDPQAVNR